MTLNLNLSPAEEAKLRKKAEEEGVPVEKIVRDAMVGILAQDVPAQQHPLSALEMHRLFDELADLLPPNLPEIPAEALRREYLYADDNEQPPSQ